MLIYFNISAQILTQKTTPDIIKKQVKLKNELDVEIVNMPSFDIGKL